MKKVIVILLVLVLLGACLIAAVGGFFWYRIHKMHNEGGQEHPSGLLSWLKKEPPPEVPSGPPPEPQVQPEPQPTPESQPPTATETPTPQPPTSAAPKEPAKPKPKPAAKPAPAAQPAPWEDVQPDNVRLPSNEPLVEPPSSEPSTPPPASEPYAPAKKKGPRGTLGVIFETQAEQGDVLLHVDEQLIEKQSFTASSQQKFRLAKSLPLAVGPHKVRITVVKADGKTVGKEWQVDVPEGGNPVWKAELSSSGRAMDLKEIQAR